MGGSKVGLQNGINRNLLRTELLCKGNKKEMEREIQESQWVCGKENAPLPSKGQWVKIMKIHPQAWLPTGICRDFPPLPSSMLGRNKIKDHGD